MREEVESKAVVDDAKIEKEKNAKQIQASVSRNGSRDTRGRAVFINAEINGCR